MTTLSRIPLPPVARYWTRLPPWSGDGPERTPEMARYLAAPADAKEPYWCFGPFQTWLMDDHDPVDLVRLDRVMRPITFKLTPLATLYARRDVFGSGVWLYHQYGYRRLYHWLILGVLLPLGLIERPKQRERAWGEPAWTWRGNFRPLRLGLRLIGTGRR